MNRWVRSLLGLFAVLLLVGQASATIHTVNVSNFAFSPLKTVVQPGDTVRWALVSGFHSTTSDPSSPKVWDSGTMSTVGQQYDVVFTAGDGPGPFPYHCEVHALTMMDTIFVAAVPAAPTVFTFLLNEAQANSGAGTGSFASGFGVARLSADSTQLQLLITHDVASANAAHVHFGAPGVEGAVRFAFSSPTSPISETWNLTPTDVTDLFAGNLYANVHSPSFPGGEIRGQIVRSPIIFAFKLDGNQAGTASAAAGFCVAELSADLTQLSVYCEHDVTSPIDAHIHLGMIGYDGPIQFGFSSPTSPISETWALTATDVDNLLAGYFYINIHSNDFPAGEIRGQFVLDPTAATLPLDQSQENSCAGTGSSATGTANVTLKPGGAELTVNVVHNVTGVTGGHVHLGAPCIDGAVQFGFSSATSPINEIWYLTQNDVINLFRDDLYVNIHSGTFPAGEIRGQIITPTAPTCCVGIRGNVDGDPGDAVDIGDLVYLVEYSFAGGPAPSCDEEADVNGDSTVDIGDLVYLVEYSFSGGPAPVSCP